MIVAKNNFKEVLRDKTFALLNKNEYEVRYVNPLELITYDRLDIVAKYLYVKYFDLNVDSDYAEKLYLKHIEYFNSFYESDGSNKLGKSEFLKSFNSVISSIKKNGYDKDFIIPLSENNSIYDGSHRVAICAYYGIQLPVISVDGNAGSYDYKYFKNRGLCSQSLDSLALEYLKLKKNVYIITLWPSSGGGKEAELSQLFKKYGNVVYRKEVYLENDGSVQVVKNAYKDESWLGSCKDNYIGARNKASWCFSKKGAVRVILFESNLDMIKMKDEIRSLFQIDKHAVHINDTKEEALVLAGLFFNENSIKWMNGSVIREFSWFERLLLHYKEWIEDNEIPRDEICIDGSSTLAVYGVREVRDLDYISFSDELDGTGFKEISSHNNELQYHPVGKDEIIFNPKYHFIVDGYKYVSLDIVKVMKKARGEKKDLDDLVMIDKVITRRLTYVPISERIRVITQISFWKARIKFYLLKGRYYYLLIKRKISN